MSINVCLAALILTSTIFTNVSPQDAIREYVIRKDFFTGIKPGEFSVYDKSEKHMYYRIESNYNLLSNIKMIAYPSKQEVGRLESKPKFLVYRSEISILDPQTNQWKTGLIEQKFQLIKNLFNIDWNGHHITLGNEVATLTLKFLGTNGELLAQFRIRPASILITNKYDMKIFSDKYPEQIYLLGLAAYNQATSSSKTLG